MVGRLVFVQALYMRQRRNGFSSWEYYYNSIKIDWRLYNSELTAAFLVSMAFFILPDEIENYYLALDAQQKGLTGGMFL